MRGRAKHERELRMRGNGKHERELSMRERAKHERELGRERGLSMRQIERELSMRGSYA